MKSLVNFLGALASFGNVAHKTQAKRTWWNW